jgi:hypothetical protein
MKTYFGCMTRGALTLSGIYAIDFLPRWHGLEKVQEQLLMPGAIAAAVIWPEGIHSDGGMYWLISSILANLVFYVGVWLFLTHFVKLFVTITKR